MLQFSLKVLDPEQLFPPQEGAGLLQLLDRVLVPVPHDLLQVDQPAQEPQLPLTGQERQIRAVFYVKQDTVL